MSLQNSLYARNRITSAHDLIGELEERMSPQQLHELAQALVDGSAGGTFESLGHLEGFLYENLERLLGEQDSKLLSVEKVKDRIMDDICGFYVLLRKHVDDEDLPEEIADFTFATSGIRIAAAPPKKTVRKTKLTNDVEAMPEWCRERVRALCASLPKPPLNLKKISDIQKSALNELIGLLFGAGKGRYVTAFTGIRGNAARTYLQEQLIPAHPQLEELRIEINKRADDRKRTSNRIGDPTWKLIAAYIRLDAAVGGTAFRNLPNEFIIDNQTLNDRVNKLRKISTEELLDELPSRQSAKIK